MALRTAAIPVNTAAVLFSCEDSKNATCPLMMCNSDTSQIEAAGTWIGIRLAFHQKTAAATAVPRPANAAIIANQWVILMGQSRLHCWVRRQLVMQIDGIAACFSAALTAMDFKIQITLVHTAQPPL
jgi:hypothetical protein